MAKRKITIEVEVDRTFEPESYRAEVTEGMHHVAFAMNGNRKPGRSAHYRLYCDGDTFEEAVQDVRTELVCLGLGTADVEVIDNGDPLEGIGGYDPEAAAEQRYFDMADPAYVADLRGYHYE